MNSTRLLFRNLSFFYSEKSLIITYVYSLNYEPCEFKNSNSSSRLSLHDASISGSYVKLMSLRNRGLLSSRTYRWIAVKRKILLIISLACVHISLSSKAKKMYFLSLLNIWIHVSASLSSKVLWRHPMMISRCSLLNSVRFSVWTYSSNASAIPTLFQLIGAEVNLYL